MSIMNSLKALITNYREYAARARAVEQLSKLSNHQLADIGIERHQLMVGSAAYPWGRDQVVERAVKPLKAATTVKTNAKAKVNTSPVTRPAIKQESGLADALVSVYSAWRRPMTPAQNW